MTHRWGLYDAADRLPVAIITAAMVLALLPFVVALPGPLIVAVAILSCAGRAIAPVHQHCHSHRNLFGASALNHWYDFVLMLAAGNTTAVWELQHVVGHHRSYLDPPRDPAAVGRFGAGPLQRVVFTVAGDALSFSDSLRLARPGRARARLIIQVMIQIAVNSALLFLNWRLALLLVVIPNIVFRWMVFYFSYAQHFGVPNHDVYSGSVTRFGWTNAVFLNVGHHTAHHEKPTLHWSQLPERTEQIRARIPADCLRGVG